MAIRATMEENRLEALLVLQLHRDLTTSATAQEVIDRFAATGARRLKLRLWSARQYAAMFTYGIF